MKLWRPHPEVPECPDAVQYWCFKGEGEQTGKQDTNRKSLHFEGELNAEAAGMASRDFEDLGGSASSGVGRVDGDDQIEKERERIEKERLEKEKEDEKAERARAKELAKEQLKVQKEQERRIKGQWN